MQSYHLERDYEELRNLMAGEKDKLQPSWQLSLCTIAGTNMVERAEEDGVEGQGRVEEEQQERVEEEQHELVEEDHQLEDEQQRQIDKQQRQIDEKRRREIANLEAGLKKRMSVNDLQWMHRDAKTFSKQTIVQVVE